MITFERISPEGKGETVTFTGDQEANTRNAQMAAYLNSSDLSPNAGVRGQDFGWRLAPEIVAEMDRARNDFDTLSLIARRKGISPDDVKDFHILSYVADKSFAADAARQKPSEVQADLEEDYRARVKAAKAGNAVAPKPSVIKKK